MIRLRTEFRSSETETASGSAATTNSTAAALRASRASSIERSIADTVFVLQALVWRRDMAAEPSRRRLAAVSYLRLSESSALLPSSSQSSVDRRCQSPTLSNSSNRIRVHHDAEPS